MSGHHLHLISNHIPVYGMVFAALLLLVALLNTGNRLVVRLALSVTIAVGLLTLVPYLSGESAEHAIEELPAATLGIDMDVLEHHETAAKFVLVGGLLTGLLAIGGFVLVEKGKAVKGVLGGLLGLTVVTLVLGGWTASIGGEIRRPELRGDYPAAHAVESLLLPGSEESHEHEGSEEEHEH